MERAASMQSVFSCPFLAVVHCGAERSTWSVFRWRQGKLICLHRGFAAGPAGDWLQTSTTAMRAARQVAGGSTPLVLVLSAPQVLLKHVRAPRVEAAQRAKVIRFEVEQTIPYAVSEVIWDFVVAGGNEADEDLLLAVAKRDIVASLCAAAHSVNFKVRMILPAALTTRAAEELVRPTNDDRLLVLNVGAASATLLQIDGPCFAARSWLTGCTAHAGQAPDAGTWAVRLVHEMTRSLAYFQRQNELRAPARIILAGNAGLNVALADYLRAKLQLPVQALDVSSVFEPGPATTEAEAGVPEMADLVGAAMLYLVPEQGTANLLPPALRRRAHLRQRRPWLVAAGLLVIGALLPPLVHYHRLNTALRASLPAVEQTLVPLRARAARNRAGLEQLAVLRRQVAQLQSVEERRAAWLQLFADLQDRFATVEDVWLESLRTVPAADQAATKLLLSGRMLDKANPQAKVSPETFTRLKVLLADIVDSPLITAVETERFDNSQPGILKFDFVLVTDPARSL